MLLKKAADVLRRKLNRQKIDISVTEVPCG